MTSLRTSHNNNFIIITDENRVQKRKDVCGKKGATKILQKLMALRRRSYL